MRVSILLKAAFICCVSRRRITLFGRAGGTEIFVISRCWESRLVAEESAVAATG